MENRAKTGEYVSPEVAVIEILLQDLIAVSNFFTGTVSDPVTPDDVEW